MKRTLLALGLALAACNPGRASTGASTSNSGSSSAGASSTGSSSGGSSTGSATTGSASGTTGTTGSSSSGGSTGGAFGYGINLGYHPGFSNAQDGQLAVQAGCTSTRPKFPEYFFEQWGITISVGDMQAFAGEGMSGHVGFLIGPSAAHSTAPSGTPNWQLEQYIPANLYQPILTSSGDINPDNYWAKYVYDVVSTYKDWVKVWEVWNEPDFINDYRIADHWDTQPPTAAELIRFNGSIFDYVRMLRVTRAAAQKADPAARIALGGVGYPNFLDAVVRYTDDPAAGAVSADYPATGAAYFDVVSFHYYPLYTPGTSDDGADGFIHQRDAMAAKLTAHAVDGKAFLATETGAPHESFSGQPSGALYARNYVMKMMALAQSAGLESVQWFDLADSAQPGASTNAYDYMGLYGSLDGLSGPSQAQRTDTGKALATLSAQLHGAQADAAGTSALALPSGARGLAFRRPDGKRTLVLWARATAAAEAEAATVNLSTSQGFTRTTWDGTSDHLAPSSGSVSVALTTTPVVLVEG